MVLSEDGLLANSQATAAQEDTDWGILPPRPTLRSEDAPYALVACQLASTSPRSSCISWSFLISCSPTIS